MSRFEDRLWSELVLDYGPELAGQTRKTAPAGSKPMPAPRRVLTPRGALAPKRALALAGTALLIAIAAIVLSTSTNKTSESQAYLITQEPDGDVTVSINELTGLEAANAQLKSLGVSIRIAAVQADCTQVGQIARTPPAIAAELATLGKKGLTIKPSLIPPGETLVLSARQVGSIVGLSYGLYRDPAPTCIREGETNVG